MTTFCSSSFSLAHRGVSLGYQWVLYILEVDEEKGGDVWADWLEEFRAMVKKTEEIDKDSWKLVEDYLLLTFEPVTSPQPYRYGRDYTERLMKTVAYLKLEMSKKALWSRRPVYAERPGVIFLHRLAFGVSSVLASLSAEAEWRSLV